MGKIVLLLTAKNEPNIYMSAQNLYQVEIRENQ